MVGASKAVMTSARPWPLGTAQSSGDKAAGPESREQSRGRVSRRDGAQASGSEGDADAAAAPSSSSSSFPTCLRRSHPDMNQSGQRKGLRETRAILMRTAGENAETG